MIQIARSAATLSRRERLLALRALGCLVFVHAALYAVGLPAVRRLVGQVPSRSRLQQLTPAECHRAMRRAGRLWPGAGCLAHAVAAAVLLRRDGMESVLHLGVALDPIGRFEAHAWLESAGMIVTGGSDRADFQPLLHDPIGCCR